MPVQTSYPGVYVQEVPSGVRTITGVSTSVTAFAGECKRGPISKATEITSFADFERQFGGLSSNSEMSFSVRQFFLNGGSRAIIIRLAKNAVAATYDLLNEADKNALHVSALDLGKAGNSIELRVDYPSTNPDSVFNLFADYTSSDNPSDTRSEAFLNLSMNSFHARFVETIVNELSTLIRVSRTADLADITNPGMVLSGDLTAEDLALIDATHNSFRLSVNGSDPVTVVISGPVANHAALAALIQADVILKANGDPALTGFTCNVPLGEPKIRLVSGVSGEKSRVEVLPAAANNVASILKLGPVYGGKQIDAVAPLRPKIVPLHSSLTSGNISDADLDTAPSAGLTGKKSFQLSLDGGISVIITIDPPPPGTLSERLTNIANQVQTFVNNLKPAVPAYRDFKCERVNDTLVFRSGTAGSDSAVVISAVTGDILANTFKLLVAAGATISPEPDIMLQRGNDEALDDTSRYAVFTGSRAARTGIYALENSDIFNLLCLPGIVDPGILMESEAYCRERRAFLIVDSPLTSVKPAEMIVTMAGTDLPKSDHAAVYYPWIKIADPLNGGRLRITAPSGTLAGLYARTDANRGVWKAPAGTDATLTGVRDVTYRVTDRENGMLNPLGVNNVRIFPDAGAVSWGARTLAGADSLASEWKYIPVRRTALFIEESLYRGLKWVVFEPNNEPLWAQIRLNVGAFMHNLFRQGAFQGRKRDDAYFVRCDRETTTQNDINLGIVNIWVGFAPLKPAEFVILYLQQMTGQIQV